MKLCRRVSTGVMMATSPDSLSYLERMSLCMTDGCPDTIQPGILYHCPCSGTPEQVKSMQGAVHACRTAHARVCSNTSVLDLYHVGRAESAEDVRCSPGEEWNLDSASMPAAALIRLMLCVEPPKWMHCPMSCICAGWGVDVKGCVLETDLKR